MSNGRGVAMGSADFGIGLRMGMLHDQGRVMEDVHELTDEALMVRAGQGDDHAFALLVRRHQHLIHGTVARMIGTDSAEIEDVAQQVFVRAYRAAPRYQATAKFTTWLLTICRNCVFTHLKQRKRWRTEPLERPDDEEGPGGPRFEDPAAGTSRDALMEKELQEALQAALGRLPEKQRMALVLRQYEQLDYEEIAAALQTSVPSVKSLLFRARETLREALQVYLGAT